MSRPLTRAQKLENAAFLRVLTRTGNARLSAREVGVAYGTMQHRRKQHAAFAQRWDAAVVVADSRLEARGGSQGPSTTAPSSAAVPLPKQAWGGQTGHRTLGGEPVVVRRRDGKLQVRRAQPRKLTKQCEQAFLAALSATANVKLSAKAAGANENAFYRRRDNNPGFAREMRLALEMGYERLECSLMESTVGIDCEDDQWRHNEPPATPPMTFDQTMQLLYLHHKTAKLWDERPYLRTRPHETSDQRSARVGMIWEAERAREAEDDRVAEALRNEGPPSPHEPLPPVLPDLAQVTGWSKADPAKRPHHPEVGVFGGWRIGDLSAEQQALAKRRREERGRGS